jgi:hypothetical protein
MFARRGQPFVDLRTTCGVVWLEPRLCAEISLAEIVEGPLRAPSWLGFGRDSYRHPQLLVDQKRLSQIRWTIT